MAGPERTRQQYLEHHEQARREEPLRRASVETAEIAADTTKRGAAVQALATDDPGIVARFFFLEKWLNSRF